MNIFDYILLPLLITSRRPVTRQCQQEDCYKFYHGQHWMLLVAKIKEKQVYVLNSISSATYSAAAEQYINLFRYINTIII